MDIVNSDDGFLAETWPENEWNKLIDLTEGIYYEFANCLVMYSNCLNNPFQFRWKHVIDTEKFTFIEHGNQVSSNPALFKMFTVWLLQGIE